MTWFKTMWLSSKERAILREAKEREKNPQPVQVDIDTKPYQKIIYSNGNLTVIMKDGTVFSRSSAPVELFRQVRDAFTEQEIQFLLMETIPAKTSNDSQVETPEERRLVNDNLEVLRNNHDFDVKGNEVFLKGVNLAMPAPIIASFIELYEKLAFEWGNENDQHYTQLEDQISALKMFWLKLALNPLPQSREDLLVFVRKNDIRITRNGNLILYRRIVTKTGADTQFVTFITQEYYRAKKDGLDPRTFGIAKTLDGYVLVNLETYVPNDDPNEVKPFINLQQAYLELPTYDSNTFTAHFDRNVEIKLGDIYRIPEDKIDLRNSICAAGGLHAAAVDYNYSGFGDLMVVVLVNPSKAITVPMGETGKLRTTEMFVACVNDKPQGVHFDDEALSAFDSEYHDLTLDELETAAKDKSFKALSVQDEVPAVSLVDLATIKDMLKGRIRTI
jgi:hypothetical protein